MYVKLPIEAPVKHLSELTDEAHARRQGLLPEWRAWVAREKTAVDRRALVAEYNDAKAAIGVAKAAYAEACAATALSTAEARRAVMAAKARYTAALNALNTGK